MYNFMLAEDLKKLKMPIEAEKLSQFGYIFQNKYDGERATIEINYPDIQIFNRRNKDITYKFPKLVKQYSNVHFDITIDGEIVVFDKDGINDFLQLQSIAHSEKEDKIKELNAKLDIRFVVFDVLELNGNYQGMKPYSERYQLLKNTLPYGLIQNYDNFWDCWNASKEGVIAKRLNSIYQHKRTFDWIKIKKFQEAKLGFTGFEEHSNKAGITLTNDKGDRVSVGSSEIADSIKSILQNRKVVYIEVQYLEKEESGLMRFPSFKRICDNYETRK